MALSKAEVRNAFREVAMRELSTIPPKETIDHSFSKQFYEKMVSLIAEQKRGSWRLLSRQRRRALVVAAILVLSMLLVACTPTLRNAVSDFIVSVYERFVDYKVEVELQPELYKIYEINSIPAEFKLVSSELIDPYCFETVYKDETGELFKFTQQAGRATNYSADNEHSKVEMLTIAGYQTVTYTAESTLIVVWVQDNYQMTITYTGVPTDINAEEIIESVLPRE